MISVEHEPTITVSGHEVTAIVRVSVNRRALGSRWLFVGEKHPLAIICRTEGSEQIFDVNGCRIDAAKLKKLMTIDGA